MQGPQAKQATNGLAGMPLVILMRPAPKGHGEAPKV